jgi:NADH-quinone oxidoreductase subunit L
VESLLWLIPVLPLIGFLINGGVYLIAGRGRTVAGGHDHDHAHAADAHDHGHAAAAHADDHDHGAHPSGGPTVGLPAAAVAAIGVAGPVIAFLLAVGVFLSIHEGQGSAHVYWNWMTAGTLSIGFGLRVDALTSVMLLVITGIGSLIHLYSYGYMHEDPAVARFFAYLNLFMCAMLILVMGDSLPLMFVGWEGVGLCSYLLIGFWYEDLANVDAGRKAFVANRVGDFAFLLGMFALFALGKTLDFAGLSTALSALGEANVLATGPFAGWTVGAVMTFAGFCLFIGATGKSAQIPLFVWLPDAMAGPTPVSALIHAATMVTAGVYMLGRLNFLYVHLPGILALIGFVAACTSLFSGIIAVAQNDIKKVLAYSTISQLGFMFAGMATSEFASGMFHVVTHAFFKALLFLGAGAVIHGLHGEQDIRKMGGLWKDMRGVAVLFIIGSIALAGLPPLAGFWSKDEILGNVAVFMLHEGGIWTLTFLILLATAALTAFYTTRLVVLTFFGPPHDPNRHPHATHWTMMTALVVLAGLSLVGGALGGPLEAFTEPLWKPVEWLEKLPEAEVHHAHLLAMGLSVLAAVGGCVVGGVLYGSQRGLLKGFVEGAGAPLHQVVLNKFYVDELYDAVFVGPIRLGAPILWAIVDRMFIDRTLVEGPAMSISAIGVALRRSHTGVINVATGSMVLGTVAMLGYVFVRLVTHG